MKPNVTIRIQCPGSKDVDAEKHEGHTFNILASVDEEFFKGLNACAASIELSFLRTALPGHIFDAFRGMIFGSNENRIEILQGITTYSCYRKPVEKVVLSGGDGTRLSDVPGEILKKITIQPFRSCGNCFGNKWKQCQSDARCRDVAAVNSSDDSRGDTINGAIIPASEVPCGNHCPSMRLCFRSHKCMGDNSTINP